MKNIDIINLIISLLSFIIIIIIGAFYYNNTSPILIEGDQGPYNKNAIGPTGPKMSDINADITQISIVGPKGPKGPIGESFIYTNVYKSFGFTDDVFVETYQNLNENITLNNAFNSIYIFNNNSNNLKITLNENINSILKKGQILLFDLNNSSNDILLTSTFFKNINSISDLNTFDNLSVSLKSGKISFLIYLGSVDNLNNQIQNNVVIKSEFTN